MYFATSRKRSGSGTICRLMLSILKQWFCDGYFCSLHHRNVSSYPVKFKFQSHILRKVQSDTLQLWIVSSPLCVWKLDRVCSQTLTHSQALQPMQGLGQLKKSPPTISILSFDPPISDSQPLCIPHHSIHPSEVWPPTRLLPPGLYVVKHNCQLRCFNVYNLKYYMFRPLLAICWRKPDDGQ